VPPLVLQPLAENAVRHGLWPRAAAGVLTVSARRDNGSLVLAVEDDGVGLATSAHRTPGRGNANLSARLTQLYGRSARFSLRPRAAGGTIATVTVPYRRSDVTVPR
jgi:LytS/YehU family sensor histidine kinase